jgi:hypothetical protein
MKNHDEHVWKIRALLQCMFDHAPMVPKKKSVRNNVCVRACVTLEPTHSAPFNIVFNITTVRNCGMRSTLISPNLRSLKFVHGTLCLTSA